MKAIGVDLGGTNILAAVVDSETGIVEQKSTPTQADKGREHVLDRIAETVLSLAENHDVIGIGMGMPGMVSKDQTTVSYPPNLPGWKVVKVADALSQRTSYACKVENDANIAALGSLHFGAGQTFNDFIMITLGTGVGGGVILNRQLFKGPGGLAGELGHVIINYDGPLSNSVTPGTIEAYLGQRFLSTMAAKRIAQHPENPLYKKFNDDFSRLEPVDLSLAANEGNELAINILAQSGQRLGYAIINYIHTLDIRKFVVGGGVSKAGELIFEPARQIIQKHLMEPYKEGFELVGEELGNESALLGAAGLAFQSFS